MPNFTYSFKSHTPFLATFETSLVFARATTSFTKEGTSSFIGGALDGSTFIS
jgi:hypothetical protein